jgi:hypothetical protein
MVVFNTGVWTVTDQELVGVNGHWEGELNGRDHESCEVAVTRSSRGQGQRIIRRKRGALRARDRAREGGVAKTLPGIGTVHNRKIRGWVP